MWVPHICIHSGILCIQSDTFTTYVFGQAIEVTPTYMNNILGLDVEELGYG